MDNIKNISSDCSVWTWLRFVVIIAVTLPAIAFVTMSLKLFAATLDCAAGVKLMLCPVTTRAGDTLPRRY